MKGVFPDLDDGTEVVSVDRSGNGLLLAVGDGFGRLRLYRYPCPSPSPSPAYHELKGHGSGPLARVKFLTGGKFLVSVGANDRCVLQWELTGPGAETDSKMAEMKDPAEVVAEEESDGYVLDMRDGSDLEREEDFETASEERASTAFLMMDQGWAVGSRASSNTEGRTPKPWEQATVAPTRPPPSDRAPPRDGLELERMHGYRGRDARNNAAYGGSNCGQVVYTAASAGVSLDLTNKVQSFQLGHAGDCVSLAVSPDGLYAATGDVSRRPTVIVWEVDTARAVQTLYGFHKRAILALAFSPDNRYLATQGCDDDHSLAVYNWRNHLLKAQAKGGKRKCLGVAWNSMGQRLVTCGLKHINFWKFGDRNLSHSRGFLGSKGRLQTMECCAFVGDTAVVGTGDGHLYIFEDGATSLSRSIKAHTGSVYALHAYNGHGGRPGGLWSGGKDGMVKLYNEEMTGLKEYSISNIETKTDPKQDKGTLVAPIAGAAGGRKRAKGGGSLDSAVRSVFLSSDQQRLLVGVRGGELYEVSVVDGSDINGAPLTAGHGKGEVSG
ncbi:unnamed protein product, partial [Choristocarpus tenellus]